MRPCAANMVEAARVAPRFLACATRPRNRSRALGPVAASPGAVAFDRGHLLPSHCFVRSRTKIGHHDFAADDISFSGPHGVTSNLRTDPLSILPGHRHLALRPQPGALRGNG